MPKELLPYSVPTPDGGIWNPDGSPPPKNSYMPPDDLPPKPPPPPDIA